MASTNFVLEGQESPEVEPSAEQMRPGSFTQTIRRTMRDELLDNFGLPLSSTCRHGVPTRADQKIGTCHAHNAATNAHTHEQPMRIGIAHHIDLRPIHPVR